MSCPEAMVCRSDCLATSIASIQLICPANEKRTALWEDFSWSIAD